MLNKGFSSAVMELDKKTSFRNFWREKFNLHFTMLGSELKENASPFISFRNHVKQEYSCLTKEQNYFFSLIKENKEEQVFQFLKKNRFFDCNCKDNYGYTPLLLAEVNNNKYLINLLKAYKATLTGKEVLPSLQWCESPGREILANAVRYGHTNVLAFILHQAGQNIDHDFITLNMEYITLAAWEGHTKVVELLIKAGADINAGRSRHTITPLIAAAQNGHIDIVTLLLKLHAQRDYQTKEGLSAAIAAEKAGHMNVVNLLNTPSSIKKTF